MIFFFFCWNDNIYGERLLFRYQLPYRYNNPKVAGHFTLILRWHYKIFTTERLVPHMRLGIL